MSSSWCVHCESRRARGAASHSSPWMLIGFKNEADEALTLYDVSSRGVEQKLGDLPVGGRRHFHSREGALWRAKTDDGRVLLEYLVGPTEVGAAKGPGGNPLAPFASVLEALGPQGAAARATAKAALEATHRRAQAHLTVAPEWLARRAGLEPGPPTPREDTRSRRVFYNRGPLPLVVYVLTRGKAGDVYEKFMANVAPDAVFSVLTGWSQTYIFRDNSGNKVHTARVADIRVGPCFYHQLSDGRAAPPPHATSSEQP